MNVLLESELMETASEGEGEYVVGRTLSRIPFNVTLRYLASIDSR